MTRVFAFAAVAALVVILGSVGLFITLGEQANADVDGIDPVEAAFDECRGSAIAGAGEIGGPFELISETGETVTDADVITEPTLIYFGYTFCPDVCPLDAVRNADAVAILEERGMSALPVFISVDPQRDTPEHLAWFTDNIHERLLGLTGSTEQIDGAVQAYRAYYNIHDSADEFYLVDHTAFTYLVMPEHGFVDFFRHEVTSEDMADRMACFIDASS